MENNYIRVTSLTLIKLNFIGKWVEFWFKSFPIKEDNSFHVSTKKIHIR